MVEEEGGDCREMSVEPGGERVIGGLNGGLRTRMDVSCGSNSCDSFLLFNSFYFIV